MQGSSIQGPVQLSLKGGGNAYDRNVKTMKECGNMENAENAETRKVRIVGMRISEMRTDVASTYVLRPRLGIWCL